MSHVILLSAHPIYSSSPGTGSVPLLVGWSVLSLACLDCGSQQLRIFALRVKDYGA